MRAGATRTALWLPLITVSLAGGPTSAVAQAESEPDFAAQASCADLRRATQGVNAESETRLQLSVVGRLTLVEFDGTVAYLAVCEAPDPKVLCIAYGTNGFQVGDSVVLSGGVGGYRRVDADHILLDPCLAEAGE
jgi:hypothetical protein